MSGGPAPFSPPALVCPNGVESRLSGWSGLLRDAVESGASIGFLHPMADGEADAYWRGVAADIDRGGILMFGIDEDDRPVATIQLHLSPKPNAAHRAEVAKLMVHRRARGRGLGKALLAHAEAAAARLGKRLLVLDTVQGSEAEGLYRAAGWTQAGVIPGYALSSRGGAEATVLFWKQI